MGGISGFCSFNNNYLSQANTYTYLLERMGKTLAHRGTAGYKSHVDDFVGFASVNAPGEASSMRIDEYEGYCVVADGEIYNRKELLHLLESKGYICKTKDLSEMTLGCYLHYGSECASVMNGVFSFVVWDAYKKMLFMCRDRLGVKPLFYTIANGNIVFASEIKALFDFPGVNASIDSDGLSELFGMFPSRSEGNGIFKDIKEIKYGHYGVYRGEKLTETSYWNFTSLKNDFSYDEAVEHTRYLVTDSVIRQMESARPVCTFLSGGVDSSIVTAIAASECKKNGAVLDTFSFDFEDNDVYFKANEFQGDTDKKWAIKASAHFETNHHFVECGMDELVKGLYPAVDARDLPGMADIDSSMLCLCREVAKTHSIALTGECADELFGGYPWFQDVSSLKIGCFPWLRQWEMRKSLLSDDLIRKIDPEAYATKVFKESIDNVPLLHGESFEAAQRRKMAYINIKWYMTNLIERTERMGSMNSFVGRIPFADYRLAEFLWNLPWEIKCDGTPKSLLREAFKDILPPELLHRKKSPFPKTYNPKYESAINGIMKNILDDKSSRILDLVKKEKLSAFMNQPTEYGKPWFGQLMAGPQLIAFFIQMEYWLRKYDVTIIGTL